LEPLKVDQPIDAVSCGEGIWVLHGLVLFHPDRKVAGNTCVEPMEGVGQDVDVVLVIARWARLKCSGAPGKIRGFFAFGSE
jgi:hypothetical protein